MMSSKTDSKSVSIMIIIIMVTGSAWVGDPLISCLNLTVILGRPVTSLACACPQAVNIVEVQYYGTPSQTCPINWL